MECTDGGRHSSGLARFLTRAIDWFYFPFFRALLPLQTFRYAVCGGGNLLLNWFLFGVTYNFIIAKQVVDLGFFALKPYVATLIITFPITFFTGFWLQKNIAFKYSPLRSGIQLFRYLLSVSGALLLNYAGLKFFVEVCAVYPTPSQMLVSLISIAYSYFMQKYFTFRGCDVY